MTVPTPRFTQWAAALLLVTPTVALTQTAPASATATAPSSALPAVRAAYVPHRVYDSGKKRWVDFETLVQRVNASELVFVGEQHNDTPGHVMELAILEGIQRRRGPQAGVTLSLEMFERDVQGTLDEYLSGQRDEPAFLAQSRPWPNYAADYRPLVELAKAASWPVIASNIPRSLASAVSRAGLTLLDTLNPDIRFVQVAARLECPEDKYFERFTDVMKGGHGGPTTASQTDSAKAAAKASTKRFYEAQCAKDETMGESVARALDSVRQRSANALVIHLNGAFHSDFGQGTAERAVRRSRDAKQLVISIVPVPNLDDVDAKSMRKRADFLVFTLARPAAVSSGR